MKALVISGGGSKGAFAGGIAEYLITECGKDYDLMVGSSAGALLLPHLAIGNIEKIKKIYTSATRKTFLMYHLLIRGKPTEAGISKALTNSLFSAIF